MGIVSFRQKRFIGGIALTGLVVVVLLLWTSSQVEDPVINGKHLSRWLVVYPTARFPLNPKAIGSSANAPSEKALSVQEQEEYYRKSMGGEKVVQAFRALLSAREKSFPVLVRMLERNPSRLERAAAQVLNNLELQGWAEPLGTTRERQQAVRAFLDLKAADCDFTLVMPKLEQLRNYPNPEVAGAAGYLVDRLKSK